MIPPKLRKRIEAEATEHALRANKPHWHDTEHLAVEKAFKEGAHAMWAILEPEIQKLVDALNWIKDCDCDRESYMSKALAAYREALGEWDK